MPAIGAPSASLVYIPSSGRATGVFQAFDRHQTTPQKTPSNPPAPTLATPSSVSRAKLLASAGGLLGAALLLRRLPVCPSSFTLLSSDWKNWAKVFLGVGAIDRLNKALGWKPPAWLGAMETVALINPLMLAHDKRTLVSSLRQILVMAPLVGGMVQATSTLSERTEHRLESQYHIPPIATRLGFSLLTMGLGIKIYPSLYKGLARTGVMGEDTRVRMAEIATDKKSQASVFSTGIANLCHRGCCASVVCMSEMGEYLGALGNWLRNRREGVNA